MESVIVVECKEIELVDLIAGQELSFPIPSDAESVTLLRSENGQSIQIEFIRDVCECQHRERVLRNVQAVESAGPYEELEDHNTGEPLYRRRR